MSSRTASAASANTAVVEYEGLMLGEDASGKSELTGAAGIQCNISNYVATVEESTIRITPSFEACQTSTLVPATITMNGCYYKLTLGTLQGHSAPATAALDCVGGGPVVIHVYTNIAHEGSVCTIEIPEQSGLGGLAVTDQTNGHLLVEGTVGGITNYIAGGCATQASGGKLDTLNPGNAALHVSITLRSLEDPLRLE